MLPRFGSTYEWGDLTLDLVNHEVHRNRRRIELSARELTLLKVLNTLARAGFHAH
jgi:DNA-binding response OmpR family regulator